MLKKLDKLDKYFLLGILLLAFLVRLYRIDNPLLDWHSWRQADTASVTREFVKNGIDLLHPKYHDLSNIPSGLDNSQHGYRMVEFPYLNALVALIIITWPSLDIVITSRLLSILFSLLTLVSLYQITLLLWSKQVARLTSLVFALLPYSVYYSRVILPEPATISLATFSIWQFLVWVKTKNYVSFWLSAFSLSLGMLLKPFVVFLGPVYLVGLVYFLTNHKSKKISFYILLCTSLLGFATVVFLPFWWWRNWIQMFPSGIPASQWLFNGNGIRFRPAWFRWLGYERFSKLIWGYWGVILAVLSLRSMKHSFSSHVFLSWWLGIVLYLTTFATGNVQHDYYQVLAIPIVSITTALGISQLYKWLKNVTKQTNLAMGISSLLFGLMLIFSWQQVKGYFNVNHWEYHRAGQAVDLLTPADAKVIAPAFGDTAFLYQTNRRGWPIGFSIDEKILQGASHYVSTAYDDEARQLESKYAVIEKNSDFIIIDLTNPKLP